MENIDDLKRATHGAPTYRLKHANVYVSDAGLHYIDYLDPVQDISPAIDHSQLTAAESSYIENSLQSNQERFEHQVAVVAGYMAIEGAAVLDIGCGGGLFLSKLKQRGACVTGIELSDSRACYATRHGIEIKKYPIESAFWQKEYAELFDAVTLWDVIEHVNYPFLTLCSAVNVLQADGLMFIDTPCRDSFYHRVGAFVYKLSGGRFPLFLNTLYSAHLFGHKQIFATYELRELMERAGLEVLELRKFHELSFPYSFYLKKMFKSDRLVRLLLPLVKLFLTVFPVKNKMLVVARKRSA